LAQRVESSILYFSDEMRYGMMSNVRRSWSRVGERSVLPQKQAFTNSYLFTAINPPTGDSFHLLGLDEMSTETEYLLDLLHIPTTHNYTYQQSR
jgi:hypothetical protein